MSKRERKSRSVNVRPASLRQYDKLCEEGFFDTYKDKIVYLLSNIFESASNAMLADAIDTFPSSITQARILLEKEGKIEQIDDALCEVNNNVVMFFKLTPTKEDNR